MNYRASRRCWQFSLRHFLVAAFVVGPLLGFFGPFVWETFLEWNPSSDVPARAPVSPRKVPSYESESYYESGETPLY